jgi:hypothetical protein
MSFDRLIKQDLFRSGGGPHRTFIEKMTRRTPWKSLRYRFSPYHRLVLAIEKRQLSCGSRRSHSEKRGGAGLAFTRSTSVAVIKRKTS